MRHLYQQIFVTIVGTAVVCGAFAGALSHVFGDDFRHVPPVVLSTARYLVEDLPAARPQMRREVRRRARRSGVSIAIYDRQRRPIASEGGRLPRPQAGETEARWFTNRHVIGVIMPLEDGRWIAVGHPHRKGHPGFFRLVGGLGLLLLLVLAGSYWAARRITRRLEALGDGVTRLGSGDLRVQVPVEGSDEVAALASQFNATSARIAGLLEQQRRVLAGASHELRSPLARLRMALELLAGAEVPAPERRGALMAECERDIEELDALVDDILLGARLRDAQAEQRFSPVDVAEVATAEAVRAGVEADVEPATLAGDRRALASLVRNLLENAKRYGAPPITITLRALPHAITLWVDDAGEVVAEAERERIFEPFYRPPGRAEGQGGAGLGLALVRDIASHHGGTVVYEAREGGGSRFVVSLPC